jgi:hypothetical protein
MLAAWQLIDSGTESGIWNGNLAILQREQTKVVAPYLALLNGMTVLGIPASWWVTLVSGANPPFTGASTFLDWSKAQQVANGGGGLFSNTAVRWNFMVYLWNTWQQTAGRFAIVGNPLP